MQLSYEFLENGDPKDYTK